MKILGTLDRRDCSKPQCKKSNPNLHGYVHEVGDYGKVGWRCKSCGTLYPDMSYTDYKQLLKQKP